MEFDLRKLTAKAFSYVGPNFPAWYGENKKTLVLPSLKGIGRGLLNGKPYFQTLKVFHKSEGEMLFPNEPLISIGLTKTIVETATVGKDRKGSVKEYITTEDYTLRIRGLCFNPRTPQEYPSDQVSAIEKIFQVNDSLTILENPFLELFDIGKIVLKDIDFEDMAGMPGMQKYTISAVSDQDFYADQKEKEKNQNLNNQLG